MGSGEEFPPAKGPCLPKADLHSKSKLISEGNEGSFTLNTSPGNSETLSRNKKYCPKSKYKTSKLCPWGGRSGTLKLIFFACAGLHSLMYLLIPLALRAEELQEMSHFTLSCSPKTCTLLKKFLPAAC